MLIQKIRCSKLLLPSAALALLLSMALEGKTQDNTTGAPKSEPVGQIILVVPNFKGASDSEVMRVRDGVEDQQRFIRRTLLEQLKDEHLSPLARTEAISLLGSFSPNDPETILALIQNIDVIAPPRFEEISSGRFTGFVARRVLARMGISAEREILEIIGSQRPTYRELKANPNLISYSFDSSKVEGFADVLTQIEGKQFARLKLQDGQRKAKTPTIKAQFQAVIDVVKKGAARAPRIKY